MCRFALLLVSAAATVHAQQRNDPSFDVRVLAPAHTTRHPRVLIDAAHLNVFSTTTDRVLPLTQLLRADGFDIDIGHDPFTAKNLANAEILVILTAMGKPAQEDPAFTPQEIEAVYQWVYNGGTMLFCLDHFPFGPSGRQMAERFGIRVSLGYVADSITSDRWHDDVLSPIYSRANGGLQDHPITVGRTAAGAWKGLRCSVVNRLQGQKQAAFSSGLRPLHSTPMIPEERVRGLEMLRLWQ